MKKTINIPIFGDEKEILKSVQEIRDNYISEYDIINSELSKQQEELIENGLTKIGYTITGVDINLEKRKESVKVLLTENLNVIVEKNEYEIKKETRNSSSYEEIFPNIDYEYWMNRNPFYSDDLLLPTMKICITNYTSKPGLINDILEKIDTITCNTLVSIIENEIINIIENDLFEDKNKMLRVFDLINGWGGKMGKATYVRPKGNTTRNTIDTWFHNYAKGVLKAINGEKEGLNDFTKIPNVGDSFGTKHLYFWSLYGGNKPIPIYDARIKTLLYLSIDESPSFETYLEDMVNFSNLKNITINQLEKALFAFSSNYFPNESLNLKNDAIDKTNYNEAKKLELFYNSNN
jgi:hypothetical protein